MDKKEQLPDRCPICKKVSRNVLLHIRKKESCCSKIDQSLYDHWKEIANKRTKTKYQKKYVESGRHKEAQERYGETGNQRKAQERYVKTGMQRKAQERYVKTGKHREAQDRYVKTGKQREAQARYVDAGNHMKVQRKYEAKFYYCNGKGRWNQTRNGLECSRDERISYHEIKRHDNSKYRNRRRIMSGQYDGKKRLKDFRWMCKRTLYNLRRGEFPQEMYSSYKSVLNSFQLVEPELVKYKLKDFDQYKLNNQDDDDDDDEEDDQEEDQEDRDSQNEYDMHDDQDEKDEDNQDDKDEQDDPDKEDDQNNQDNKDDPDEQDDPDVENDIDNQDDNDGLSSEDEQLKDLNKFQDEVHDWLKDVDGTLLNWIIEFQKVVLVPKRRWLKALKDISSKTDKTGLRNTLFRLIGKLQSYKNQNTEDIQIPKDYQVNCTAKDICGDSKDLSDEEEDLQLVEFLKDILGYHDEYRDELQELIGIENDMDNLEVAMTYTKSYRQNKL